MEEELRMQALDLNQQAVILLNTGNLMRAEEKCIQAINIDPMVMESYKNLGDIYLSKENYEDAKNYYKKALLIEKSPIVYFQYGSACFLNNEPSEGMEYYNLALSSGEANEEMFFFVGLAYEQMNRNDLALRYIQKAILANPVRPEFKVKKVELLIKMGQEIEAEEVVDQILKSDPELFFGYHQKIIFMLESGRIDEARQFAKKATEKFPEDVDLMFDYARCALYQKDYDMVFQLIRNAKQMQYFQEEKSKFCFLEAQVNAEQGKFGDAIKNCWECIEIEQNTYPEVRFMLINLYLLSLDFEKALAESEQMLENVTEDAYYLAALYYKPFCLKMLGKEEEAMRYYKEAISIYRLKTLKNPEVAEAYMYRAMCLKDMQEYEEALKMIELMEHITSGVPEVIQLRAEIYKIMQKEDI